MYRPDRSDAHLPPEEQARIEAETREYFQSIAPKRHPKPSRSEYSTVYSDDLPPSDRDPFPELQKLQNLASDPKKLVLDGSEVVEDYAETEYYDGLNCVDKQHHTTGTGFIKVEKPSSSSLDLNSVTGASDYRPAYKGNPATNDWIPSADIVIPVSHKPNRSDI